MEGETQLCPTCRKQVSPRNGRAVAYYRNGGEALSRLHVAIDPSSENWRNLRTTAGGILGAIVEAACCNETCAQTFERKSAETARKRTRRSERILAGA